MPVKMCDVGPQSLSDTKLKKLKIPLLVRKRACGLLSSFVFRVQRPPARLVSLFVGIYSTPG